VNPLISTVYKAGLPALALFALAAVNAWAVPITIDADTSTNFDFTANFLSLGNSTATSPQGGKVSVVELAGNEFQFSVQSAVSHDVLNFFPYLLWESHNPNNLLTVTGFFEGGGYLAEFHYLSGLAGAFPFADYDNRGNYLVFDTATFHFGDPTTDPLNNGSSQVPDASSTLCLMALSVAGLALLRCRLLH
jgi:hypothetical protein